MKNVKTEGPGTIEDFLKDRGIPYRIVDLECRPLPDTEEFGTLVMMGGPMSVNESDVYPYIKKEKELVRDFIKNNKKILGICLGAQIIANALGAKVYTGPKLEIGWHDIELTEAGLRDCLMKKLAIHPKAGDFWKRFKVLHWHGETFDMPSGAERLAKSDSYQNQAFKYGDNAYAFQFHIEVTRDMVYDWFSATGGSACGGKNEAIDMGKLKTDTENLYDVYHGRALNFYKAFFK